MHFIDNIYPLYQIYSKQKNTKRREKCLKNYIGGLDIDLILEGNPLELMEQIHEIWEQRIKSSLIRSRSDF